MELLRVENLRISFSTPAGQVQAVRGVSFSLLAGQTLCLVGESGSGKSVTSRAIMGILGENARILGGKIWFEGRDLLAISEREHTAIRGSRIAMVFQDPLSSLNPILRIGRQITEVMRLKGGLTRQQARKKALRLLQEVGIRDPERCFDQFPFQLSGGQRQRIVIAIALAADPQVLICDEPTTALDVTIQAQILELLQRLQKQRQLALLFITHDFGVVANMASHIAVMYAGQIVERGTAEEIFYDPRHPYTWSLLSSMPDLHTAGRLYSIAGTPPDMTHPPVGDAFAPRNPWALEIDFEQPPPVYRLSDTHEAATWLLHPDAPPVQMPQILAQRIREGGGLAGGEVAGN